MYKPVRSAWRSALFLITLSILWILFAPRQLGGQVSYVIVDGTSMLPRFHKGDLVLVRQAAEYPVNTIATYRYPGIGPVIHRIIGRNGLHYIMQGDNNHWVDGYQPVIEDMIGAYWLHLPGAGNLLIQLRSPFLFALLVGCGTILVGLSMQTNAQPRRGIQEVKTFAASAAAQMNTWAVSWREGVYTIVFILGLGGCLLLVFGWLRPASRISNVEVPLTQMGVYTYGAGMPPGIYDQNRLDSGSAIYPDLNCTVRLLFTYTLTSQKDAQVEGTHHLTGVVSDEKGWQRSIELEKETTFSGTQAEAGGNLDLCAFRKLIADMQMATGVQEMQYQLNLYPRVRVKGKLGWVVFQDQFDEPLSFIIEPHRAYLLKSSKDDALTQTKPGLAQGQFIVDNTLPVFGLALPVRVARILGMVGLLLAGLGCWWIESASQKADAADPRRKLTRRLGKPPVRVQSASLPGCEAVLLDSLEDFIVLAQQTPAPVLYVQQDGQITFLLETGGALYRCEMAETAA